MVPAAPGPIAAAEAQRRLLAAVSPRPAEAVTLGLDAALLSGRVLAADVVAQVPIPAFDRSAVDGFAVRSVDLVEAAPDRPLTLRCESGESPGHAPSLRELPHLRAGCTWPIATGGRVPAGADAVVMLEHATRVGDEVTFTGAITTGRNLIECGEDVAAGVVIASRGRTVGHRDLALLGAAGVTSVFVQARPQVAVLSSGAELVPFGTRPDAGQIVDVNQPALLAAVAAAGAQAFGGGMVSDDPAELAARIASLAADHDVVIISGGTSVGRADHTSAAFDRLSATTLFHGVAMRPGRPTLAAVLARTGHEGPGAHANEAGASTLLIGLPGVPAAALTIFAVFVRPVLFRLSGRPESWEEQKTRARLDGNLVSAAGREDYVRVQLEERGSELWAKPLPGSSSSLSALATADGVAIIPAEATTLTVGRVVEVIRF